jgi:hypothetical protein
VRKLAEEEMVRVRLAEGHGRKFFPHLGKNVEPGEEIGEVRREEAEQRPDFEIIEEGKKKHVAQRLHAEKKVEDKGGKE